MLTKYRRANPNDVGKPCFLSVYNIEIDSVLDSFMERSLNHEILTHVLIDQNLELWFAARTIAPPSLIMCAQIAYVRIAEPVPLPEKSLTG